MTQAGRTPFPYSGGKAHVAEIVWQRFGNPDVYAEPFSGGLAVLLARETPCRREVVCDLDGMIANFWRAMAKDPEQVAKAADWPSFHQDLTARHAYLIQWIGENSNKLSEDHRFCDAEVAGMWAWGKSNWIGSEWCKQVDPSKKVPVMFDDPSGQGIQAQRKTTPTPNALNSSGGQGVQTQRTTMPQPSHGGSRPGNAQGVQTRRVDTSPQPGLGGSEPGGRGVSANRKAITSPQPMTRAWPAGRGLTVHKADNSPQPSCFANPGGNGVAANKLTSPGNIGSGARLLDWFLWLQQRLAKVIVLNRSWESAVTPTILCNTPSKEGSYTTAVFMDPPYRTSRKTYAQDDEGDCAVNAYEWAVEHGDDYRICYCCNDGDFEKPEGWTEYSRPRKNGVKDQMFFSPRCLQTSLFG